jgi:hypothetical protein
MRGTPIVEKNKTGFPPPNNWKENFFIKIGDDQ